MKMPRNVIGLVGALLLAGAAFAASANSGNLHLGTAVTVQCKQLESSEYLVQRNGTGDTVELNITDGRKTVTTPTACIVPVSRQIAGDGQVIRDQNGSNTLAQIFLRGKDYELHRDAEAARMPAPGRDSTNT